MQSSNLISAPKPGSEIKTPKLYIEVGTFKDETWANNAVDKLTQLGFHAVLIQKSLLWSQSYHVKSVRTQTSRTSPTPVNASRPRASNPIQ